MVQYYTLISLKPSNVSSRLLSLLSVTTLIRELCEHISHCCLIFLVTLGDVLLSLSADVLGMFIMQRFDIVSLSVFVFGFTPGVSSDHANKVHVFLLVCGLRRVKDPMYLVEAFSGRPLWNKHKHQWKLLFLVAL